MTKDIWNSVFNPHRSNELLPFRLVLLCRTVPTVQSIPKDAVMLGRCALNTVLILPWVFPPLRWHACHGPYLMDRQSCQVGCGGGSQQWPPFAAEGLRSCPAPLGRAAQTAGDRNRRRQSVLGKKHFSLEMNRRDRLVRISGTMQHPYPSSIRVGLRMEAVTESTAGNCRGLALLCGF